MADAIRVSAPVSGTDKTITFETGKFAQQSQGAVIATIGGTTVLATANAARGVRDGIDFFPLTVDVEERAYAAGKIPGAFFRREGRPSEQAILTCRLIDRPLRPAFPDGYRNETQVVITVIGVDMENPHDVIAINASSAALMISGIPFEGPIGAVRMAYSQDGDWVPHPTYNEGNTGTFEIVVAGRELDNGDVAIMMVEAGGTEKSYEYYADGAPKVTEQVIADGLEASKKWIKESISLQRQLVASVIATRGAITQLEYTPVLDYTDEVFAEVERVATSKLATAITIALKADRNAATDAAAAETVAELCGADSKFAGQEKAVKEAVRSLTKKLVRKRVVEEGIRIDGRGPKDLRALTSEVGVLANAHGTGLFQRGETQVLNVCTLAMPRMNQMLDTLGPDAEKRYIHHYNMAPWANGETGRVGSPKRREIGHGALAERALLPVLPKRDEFPYAIRQVSEALGSNGSTSMGSVCASTMSLLNAGVPLKAMVAGIAMGLISDVIDGKTEYVALTDILGSEDAFGDMDFKVAGTKEFVTALQLDTKLDGIPASVLAGALNQAKDARLTILEVMGEAIDQPDEMSQYAPRIITVNIPVDKIGEVIGPKGKIINQIQEETGADISIDDDGTVYIGASNGEAAEAARNQVNAIANPSMPEVGERYMGTVVKTTNFGAFVSLSPGKDGLLHISQLRKLSGGKRVEQVEDVVKVGDKVHVEIAEIDPRGKLSLVPVVEGEEAAAEESGDES